MIAALLHLALASSGTGQVPVEAPIPPAIATTDVPVYVQLSETHFVAQSFVDEVQWLVFINEDRGLRSLRVLGPHERTLLPVVAGAADGMSIEIITRTASGSFLTSGVIDCADLVGNSIYFNREGDRFIGWIPHHGGRSLSRAKVGRSTLPKGFVRVAHASAPTTRLEDDMAAMDTLVAHVPVPTPAENRKRNKSRRLKRGKLPPV